MIYVALMFIKIYFQMVKVKVIETKPQNIIYISVSEKVRNMIQMNGEADIAQFSDIFC